jgi:O2-independent ubiquinone biosynthesis protein UbiU
MGAVYIEQVTRPKCALHLFEEPVSLKAAETLPALATAGVCAIKIEGRQRGRAYVTTALHRSIVANDWLVTAAATDVH